MKHFFLLQVLGIFLITSSLSGCSTVFGRHQDDQMVTFDSNISGVEILCSGKRAESPGSIPLRQSKSHSCTAKKDGYQKKVFRVRSGTSWAGFGHSTAVNTAIWGWWTLGIGTGIGWLVDWPSGAMRNLKDDNIYLEMKPAGDEGAGQKAAAAVMNAGKAIVNAPIDAVQGATTAVVGSTVHEGAGTLGANTDGGEEEVYRASEKAKTI